jgi:hypothetical protein
MVASPFYIDNGIFQKSAFGGAVQRIDFKGNKFGIQVSAGPFYPRAAEEWIACLLEGKRVGVMMKYPLRENQSGGGAMVVDGAHTGGTSIDVRDATPGFAIRKGFVLSIENTNGRHYFHRVRTATRVAADGTATIPIEPETRFPFADGDTVHLSQPYIQGFIDGNEMQWAMTGDGVTPIQFTLEEYE